MSSINGVNAIYTCGNIDTPGISDLDFLILTDSEELIIKKFKRYIAPSRNKENYIIGNRILFCKKRYCIKYKLYTSANKS